MSKCPPAEHALRRASEAPEVRVDFKKKTSDAHLLKGQQRPIALRFPPIFYRS